MDAMKTTGLSRTEIAEFFRHFNGKDINGDPKVVVSYQSYDADEPADSVDKTKIYTTQKATVELSMNNADPRFYHIDFQFRSFDDPELKLMWGRLQRFKHNQAMQFEKNWIFYINILSKDTMDLQSTEPDVLITANIFNPELFYLTREVPQMQSDDDTTREGEQVGGNIIRMLVPVELVSFSVNDRVDTGTIKGEVLRELEESDFIDHAHDGDGNASW